MQPLLRTTACGLSIAAMRGAGWTLPMRFCPHPHRDRTFSISEGRDRLRAMPSEENEEVNSTFSVSGAEPNLCGLCRVEKTKRGISV